MKIRPVGADLFYAEGRKDGRTEGRTDMTKLIVAFSTCANSPKIFTLFVSKMCVPLVTAGTSGTKLLKYLSEDGTLQERKDD
jgi:hypothetical protein